MGDLPLAEITRDKMREFRDILRKLPPNRTKSKLYKDKSIAEILAMSPERTLNPATINIIVEAVGSLLDWCVTEGFLDRNQELKVCK